jgi:hypothetical protein
MSKAIKYKDSVELHRAIIEDVNDVDAKEQISYQAYEVIKNWSSKNKFEPLWILEEQKIYTWFSFLNKIIVEYIAISQIIIKEILANTSKSSDENKVHADRLNNHIISEIENLTSSKLAEYYFGFWKCLENNKEKDLNNNAWIRIHSDYFNPLDIFSEEVTKKYKKNKKGQQRTNDIDKTRLAYKIAKIVLGRFFGGKWSELENLYNSDYEEFIKDMDEVVSLIRDRFNERINGVDIEYVDYDIAQNRLEEIIAKKRKENILVAPPNSRSLRKYLESMGVFLAKERIDEKIKTTKELGWKISLDTTRRLGEYEDDDDAYYGAIMTLNKSTKNNKCDENTDQETSINNEDKDSNSESNDQGNKTDTAQTHNSELSESNNDSTCDEDLLSKMKGLIKDISSDAEIQNNIWTILNDFKNEYYSELNRDEVDVQGVGKLYSIFSGEDFTNDRLKVLLAHHIERRFIFRTKYCSQISSPLDRYNMTCDHLCITPENRVLYWSCSQIDEKTQQKIAEEMGISYDALRKRKSRTQHRIIIFETFLKFCYVKLAFITNSKK